MWAAEEGAAAAGGGEEGVPLAAETFADLSLAEAEGTGRKEWPGVGLAGSRGGALRVFLGTDDAG